MKPLVSYYGGKGRIASQIVDQLMRIPHTVYAEPFAGGLAVLFAKPLPAVGDSSHYREAINDNNQLLVNLYRVAQWQPQEFNHIIQHTPYSKAEHTKALQICKTPDQYNDLQKAWAYYVNLQQSFANTANAGWRTAVIGRNQSYTWENKRQRLPDCLQRLSQVHIDDKDALDFIDTWDSPETIFYCDPPYPGSNQGHYTGYTLNDWQQLCNKLDSCQSSYILSNYPQQIQPKSAQHIIQIQATMSASGSGQTKRSDRSIKPSSTELGDRSRTEILWICNRSNLIRDDLNQALHAISSSLTHHQTNLFHLP